MKPKLLLCIILCVSFAILKAQTAEWVNQYKHYYTFKNGGTWGNNICIDKWRNVYVAGNYKQNVMHGIDSVGAFLIKYDSSGVLLWKKNIENTIISMLGLKDSIYPFIIGGCGVNTVFDTITTANGWTYIAQYNETGNILWVKSFKGADIREASHDSQGNIYIAGVFRDTITFDGISLFNNSQPRDFWMYIAKFNSSGHCVWAKQSKDWVRINTFYVDKKGASFIGGYFGPTLTLENTTIHRVGGVNGYIAKYDSSGAFQWVQNIGTNIAQFGSEKITHISADSNGNVYASGTYDQDLTIGNTYLPSYNTYFPKGFTAKFDANGACISAQNNNYFIDIINDNMYKRGTADTAGIYNGVYLHQGFYVMECDTAGNGLWAYQPTGNVWCEINADDKGFLYLTGSFGGTADFGGITATGNGEMFAAKVNHKSLVTSDNDIEDKENHLQIYPNPTSGTFKISYFTPDSYRDEKSKQQLNIINVYGQTIYTETISQFEYNKAIDLCNQAKGIYLIEIITDSKRTTKKIILD